MTASPAADLDLAFTPATELAGRLRAGELSPVDLVRNALARIEEVNPVLNCFCFVYPDEALALAHERERELAAGHDRGPLHGIPIAFKDLTPTRGKRTTRGSRVFADWVPDEDAVVVERLREAGAIMVGKTTTPEFAYDGFTQSPLWGVTRNPWNPARTPGGSSGGSGAAVASGCVPIAEGTDMGGSVRIPAAYCGLVGLKPSLGRIPMDILPTVFDNISHFGPLTRTIGDASLFMNAASGPDDRDIQSLPDRIHFPGAAAADVTGLRVALSEDLGYYAVDAEVRAALLATADALEDAGARIERVRLDWTRAIDDAWDRAWGVYIDACFIEDLERTRALHDPNIVSLVERSRTLDAAAYKRIEILRTEQWSSLRRLFESHDVLLCPTMTRTAPPVGGTDADYYVEDDHGWFHALSMTCPFNFVGQCPALTVPGGFALDALPIGVQIVGRRFDDLTVMRVGAAVERLRPWASRRPPV